MHIQDKTEHDPVAGLYIVDAYLRWALPAAAEIVGKKGLVVILREAGRGRLIDNYPANESAVIGRLTC